MVKLQIISDHWYYARNLFFLIFYFIAIQSTAAIKDLNSIDNTTIIDGNTTETLIYARIIQDHRITFHLCKEFSRKYVRQPLYLSYPQTIDIRTLPLSILDIPLITHTIAVIWLSGKTYSIEEMDEDLYHSLATVKKFFQRFFCNTSWEGSLEPKRLIKNRIDPKTLQSAALFTAGLDSTTTVFRHFNENPCLISFNEPHEKAIEFATQNGFDFVTIYTNYNNFLNLTFLDKVSSDISKWFWDTSMGLSWVGASLPFLYARGISTLYIPSGFHFGSFLFPDGQTLRQPACPIIDENLSPAELRVQHDPFTMTRTEKIAFISNFCKTHHLPKPSLVVCNHHQKQDTTYRSCNQCTKCLLTMLDILAIGDHLKDYGFSFPEEKFIEKFPHQLFEMKMRRGGTYAALRDTQAYLKDPSKNLPKNYEEFFHWFLSIDLFSLLEPSFKEKKRTIPFSWEDYRDLYPMDFDPTFKRFQ